METSKPVLPSKPLAYFGLVLASVSLILTILPFFTSWNNRQYIDMDINGGENVTSTFYLTSEYNEIDKWIVSPEGEPVHTLSNETAYYSSNNSLYLCGGNSTCSDNSNYEKASIFGILWIVFSVMITALSFYRVKNMNDDLTSPMKWYFIYVYKFVVLLIFSISIINIAMLGFIFYADTSNKVKAEHSSSILNFFQASNGIGSILFLINSIVIFALFVQNFYEFKQNFEYCTEKDKEQENETGAGLLP